MLQSTLAGIKVLKAFSHNTSNTPIKRGPNVLFSDDRNSKPKRAIPLPQGDTAYAKAKRAEYLERDLDKAENLYRRAIFLGERAPSAAKDLAGVLHQQGKTEEACSFLEQHQHLFSLEPKKYENLLTSLQKQLVPSGNCLNKFLRITPNEGLIDQETARGIFKNGSRIVDIQIYNDRCAIVEFPSHSAARKTLEGFAHWDRYKLEWMTPTGQVVGDANFSKRRLEQRARTDLVQLTSPFNCSLFLQDPTATQFSLPVDIESAFPDEEPHSPIRLDECLGLELTELVFSRNNSVNN